MKTSNPTKTKVACGSCANFRASPINGGTMGYCRFFRQAMSRTDGCRSGFVPAQRARNRRP